jgi:hypothetical protein
MILHTYDFPTEKSVEVIELTNTLDNGRSFRDGTSLYGL